MAAAPLGRPVGPLGHRLALPAPGLAAGRLLSPAAMLGNHAPQKLTEYPEEGLEKIFNEDKAGRRGNTGDKPDY